MVQEKHDTRQRRRFLRPRPQWVEAHPMEKRGEFTRLNELAQESDPARGHDNNPNEPLLSSSSEPFTYFEAPPSSSTGPTVAYNCLLIPVFFAVWWYWTKRTAQAVTKGLLKHEIRIVTCKSRHASISRTAENGDECHQDSSPYQLDTDGNSVTNGHSEGTSVDSMSELPPPPPAVSLMRDEFDTWEDVLKNSSSDENRVQWITASKRMDMEHRSVSPAKGKTAIKKQQRLSGKRVWVEEQKSRRPSASPLRRSNERQKSLKYLKEALIKESPESLDERANMHVADEAPSVGELVSCSSPARKIDDISHREIAPIS